MTGSIIRAAGIARVLRFGVLVLGAAALALLVVSTARVFERMRFDYDLLLWADDYFMTSMLKLAAGVGVYTALGDANSTIYPPGGAYLHYLFLAPFGVATSLLANRVLNQVWLFGAIATGALLVRDLAISEHGYPARTADRAIFIALAFGLLGLAAHANPVMDSLHPTNLELLVLVAAEFVLVRFERLAPFGRWALAALLTGAALLAKQTAGLAVCCAFAWHFANDRQLPALRRAVFASIPVAALGTTLFALQVTTHGLFKTWAFDILFRHAFDWWKVSDIYGGYFLIFAPVVSVIVWRGVRALRGDADHRPWRRAASVLIFYAPFALAALFKTMGGPNNLGVIGFLAAPLALPTLLGAMLRKAAGAGGALALGLAALQVALWHPRRRVPDERDLANAETICGYAAARMRCGERVLLGRGAVCYPRGGVQVPLDRMNSIIEVTVAGRGPELGFSRPRAQERIRCHDLQPGRPHVVWRPALAGHEEPLQAVLHDPG